jgi:hypothetical protein
MHQGLGGQVVAPEDEGRSQRQHMAVQAQRGVLEEAPGAHARRAAGLTGDEGERLAVERGSVVAPGVAQAQAQSLRGVVEHGVVEADFLRVDAAAQVQCGQRFFDHR